MQAFRFRPRHTPPASRALAPVAALPLLAGVPLPAAAAQRQALLADLPLPLLLLLSAAALALVVWLLARRRKRDDVLEPGVSTLVFPPESKLPDRSTTLR